MAYESIFGGVLAADARPAISTGFLSSFTTYSTFALQSATAPPALLVANVVANYACGFAAVAVGRRAAHAAVGGSDPETESEAEP